MPHILPIFSPDFPRVFESFKLSLSYTRISHGEVRRRCTLGRRASLGRQSCRDLSRRQTCLGATPDIWAGWHSWIGDLEVCAGRCSILHLGWYALWIRVSYWICLSGRLSLTYASVKVSWQSRLPWTNSSLNFLRSPAPRSAPASTKD